MNKKIIFSIISVISLSVIVYLLTLKFYDVTNDYHEQRSIEKNPLVTSHRNKFSNHINNKDKSDSKQKPTPQLVQGTLDMKAPGEGNALYVTLDVQHGKLELGYNVSVPESSIRKTRHFANHVAVIKDQAGHVITYIPVNLQKLRAVMEEEGGNSKHRGCKCEEGEHLLSGDMRFQKFSEVPASISLFKLEIPYEESTAEKTFVEAVSEQELKLIDEVKL